MCGFAWLGVLASLGAGGVAFCAIAVGGNEVVVVAGGNAAGEGTVVAVVLTLANLVPNRGRRIVLKLINEPSEKLNKPFKRSYEYLPILRTSNQQVARAQIQYLQIQRHTFSGIAKVRGLRNLEVVPLSLRKFEPPVNCPFFSEVCLQAERATASGHEAVDASVLENFREVVVRAVA